MSNPSPPLYLLQNLLRNDTRCVAPWSPLPLRLPFVEGGPSIPDADVEKKVCFLWVFFCLAGACAAALAVCVCNNNDAKEKRKQHVPCNNGSSFLFPCRSFSRCFSSTRLFTVSSRLISLHHVLLNRLSSRPLPMHVLKSAYLGTRLQRGLCARVHLASPLLLPSLCEE